MFLINENIEIHMNDRPTPETDANASPHIGFYSCATVPADFARRLERERDEARDATEKAKAYKRVLKEDNAKLRRELDEARDDTRNLLREIFNLTQIGDPQPVDLAMKALQAIAEMIDEHLKEARK